MKKMISFLLVGSMMCTLVACDSNAINITSSDNSSSLSSSSSNSQSEASSSDSSKSSSKDGIKVEAPKLGNVEITLPGSMFEGKDLETVRKEVIAAKSAIDVKINTDGSLTYILTQGQHKEILKGLATTVDESISELTNNTDYNSYFKEIQTNKDYTKITFKVDKDNPVMLAGLMIIPVNLACCMYQLFNGVKTPSVEVTLLNYKTDEVISVLTYPEKQ